MLKMLILILSTSITPLLDDYIHFGATPPGHHRYRVTSSPAQRAVLVNGSLYPLELYINGNRSTEGLVKVECTAPGKGALIDRKPVKTLGKNHVFFHQIKDLPATQKSISIGLNTKEGCYKLAHKIKRHFFEEKIDRSFFVEPGKKLELGLEIEKDKNLDLDNLTIKDGYYQSALQVGTQLITGTYTEGKKTTIIKLPIVLSVEKHGEAPVLSLKSLDYLDLNEPVVSISKYGLEFEGLTGIGSRIYVNSREIENNHGHFSFDLEIKSRETVLDLKAVAPNGKTLTARRTFVLKKYRPPLPWYQSEKYKAGDQSITVGWDHFYGTQNTFTDQSKNRENLHFTIGYKRRLSAKHFVEMDFNWFKEISFQNELESQAFTEQVYFSLLRAYEFSPGLLVSGGLSVLYNLYTIHGQNHYRDRRYQLGMHVKLSYPIRIYGNLSYSPAINLILPVRWPDYWNTYLYTIELMALNYRF